MACLVLVKPLVCILNLGGILVYISFALEGRNSGGKALDAMAQVCILLVKIGMF